MSRRDPERFRKTVNRAVGGGCLLALIAGVGLAYLAIQKKARRVRQDPLKVLEVLAKAQKRFIFSDADGDGDKAPARSITELARAGLVPEDWASGQIASYRYTLIKDETAGWAITADPLPAAPAEIKSEGAKEPAAPRPHYRRDRFDVVTSAQGRRATRDDRVISSPRRR